MKYIDRVDIRKINDKYDYVVGWGTGPLFKMNYRKEYFPIDFLIDGTKKHLERNEQTCCGIEVKDSNALSRLSGKVLVVIYAIYEKQILEQIEKYDCDVDTVIYSLINVELEKGIRVPELNAKSCEDTLLLMLIRQLELETVQFLEIGVCHPIIRNNTFLMYENFSYLDGYRGVLIEANPLCWDLIKEYRKKDILLPIGVGKEKDNLIFYSFPNLLGHSTFVKEITDKKKKAGYQCQEIEVNVENINTIIEQNFEHVPDFLALDAEGMDFDILMSWNWEKYPFKGIISEMMEEDEKNINEIMYERGYRIYAKTIENIIWVRKDLSIFV